MKADSYGFLSTYPPTQCGIATFSASLASHLAETAEVGIVRVVDRPEPMTGAGVVHHLEGGSPGAARAAARVLDGFDLAIVQHEFGIFGGRDGAEVVEVLRLLEVPAIVVLHTVLSDPTPHQRLVLQQVIDEADALVVMTRTAQRRLLDGYTVDRARVSVIPHGAPTEWASALAATDPAAPTILTWGLLGPGKGIEWAIDALALLGDLDPAPNYLVLGETHPRVLEHSGDAYRDSLVRRADSLGLADRVRFDARYLDRPRLMRLVMSADVVVLPYDSKDQVTSGVLIEAVTSRRPVVATCFPHAVELLSSGAGTVVPQRDPVALAEALRPILSEPALAAKMSAAAGRLAPDLTWRAVAGRYLDLGHLLVPGAAVGVVA